MDHIIKYIVFFFLFTFHTLGQGNLILNGDFEKYWECPDNASQIERCKYVYNPCALNVSTSDYFNACFTTASTVGVPNTFLGYQSPRSGNGMVGYFCIDGPYSRYREYIQLSFCKPLEYAHKYMVEGYFNLGNSSTHTIKNIGFLFSETRINSNDFLYENYIPQYTDSLAVINDTANWIKISFEFISDAPHQFLTIGHFLKDSTESYIQLGPYANVQYVCYFLLDDFSVKELVDGEMQPPNIEMPFTNFEIQLPNIVTPNNDNINDFIDLSEFSDFYIVNRWGEEVFNDSNSKIWKGEDNRGNPLFEGVYFLMGSYESCDEKKGFSTPITIIR
ncbi:gliding motility-associated C-terminal domain-containing protein [Fluviicola sp.]|uniref:T9SS type B sorting domain-containing protein n=1 Tax=Fluviicola sp. TaxID=1917219 RepID=UPI0031E28B9C